MKILHAGRIDFQGGNYSSPHADGWQVAPIFGLALVAPPNGINPPLGQVEIIFDKPVKQPYVVILTACRSYSTPSLAANYGNVSETGFVVHLWESCADRTVQNGGFSFVIIQP